VGNAKVKPLFPPRWALPDAEEVPGCAGETGEMTFSQDGIVTVDMAGGTDDRGSGLILDPVSGGAYLVGTVGGYASDVGILKVTATGAMDPAIDYDGTLVSSIGTTDRAYDGVLVDGVLIVAGSSDDAEGNWALDCTDGRELPVEHPLPLTSLARKTR